MLRRNAKPRNEREAHAKERALAAVARMRRDGLSLSAAAKVEGTHPNTIKRYAGSALRQKCPGGHCRVTADDRITRTLNFLSPQGAVALTVNDSRIASKIGEHMNAVRTYLKTGDTSALRQFRGESFRVGGVTHRFVTDPGTLDGLGDKGVKVESLYRAVSGKQA